MQIFSVYFNILISDLDWESSKIDKSNKHLNFDKELLLWWNSNLQVLNLVQLTLFLDFTLPFSFVFVFMYAIIVVMRHLPIINYNPGYFLFWLLPESAIINSRVKEALLKALFVCLITQPNETKDPYQSHTHRYPHNIVSSNKMHVS